MGKDEILAATGGPGRGQAGVPGRTWSGRRDRTPPDLSLTGWFSRRAARTPARMALSFEDRTWTFGELAEAAETYAAALRTGGVQRGDRVAVVSSNHPSFLIALMATGRLGGVFVPLNSRLSAPELRYILDDADPRVVCSDLAHLPTVLAGATPLGGRRLLCMDGATASCESLKDMVALVDAAASTLAPADEPSDVDDLAVIMYTSGTTGRPKGAMLTHGNLWWGTMNMIHALGLTALDVAVVVAPLFHIGGLVTLTMPTWYQGGEVVLHRAFDAGRVVADIQGRRATVTSLVPTTLRLVAQYPGFEQADLASLRVVVSGGGVADSQAIHAWGRRGVRVVTGLGMTETTGMVSMMPPGLAPARAGCAGLTPLTTDLKIVSTDQAAECRPGSTGEVLVRGPHVMSGYWRDPTATTAAFDPDGFFRTGDLGAIDPVDGCLYFVGRLTDMIVTGGENVYPAEVEAVLGQHPAVVEVAVVGVADDRWGHRVAAVVVARAGAAPSLEELRAWGEQQLARYKLPTRLDLVPELPRNASGKVLRGELRNRHEV